MIYYQLYFFQPLSFNYHHTLHRILFHQPIPSLFASLADTSHTTHHNCSTTVTKPLISVIFIKFSKFSNFGSKLPKLPKNRVDCQKMKKATESRPKEENLIFDQITCGWKASHVNFLEEVLYV